MFSKTGGSTYATIAASPFPLQGKPTQAQDVAVPVSEQVPVSMPDPPVDQTDPLTRSVPNPQLDQAELLPLSVLEQLSVLDPLLKEVPMCETAAIVSGLL